MNAPSPFSTHNPKLQVVVDATSLYAAMFCPRYYELSIIEGYRKSAVDLEFGGFYATAVEIFKKSLISGDTYPQATEKAIRSVVKDTFDVEQGPWGGRYDEVWRCTGTEPFKNTKGNKAKCPWSHKGKWFPAPAPGFCSCGSPTITERQWLPTDKYKHRLSLVRLVAGYCFDMEARPNWKPYKFDTGLPAVELSFKLPLPIENKYGEPYVLAGHIDSIMDNEGELFPADNKTTKKGLTNSYWKRYSPNVQVDAYDLAGATLFEQLKLKGVVIEAAQVLVSDAPRFGNQIFYRNDEQRREFLLDLEALLQEMQFNAERNYWPRRTVNCPMCIFQEICSKPPTRREDFLKADFHIRKWNPLEER